MEPEMYCFNGEGPYKETLKSAEVSVFENKDTGDFVFFLTKEDYGPVIVSPDFESGKEKFKIAMQKMLIFNSLLSLEDVREKVSGEIKKAYPVASKISEEEVETITTSARERMETISRQLDAAI